MYKITHKKTGFFYYLNAHEVQLFFKRQEPYKYEVKEIRTIDYKEIIYAILAIFLMSLFCIAIVYFATN